MGLPIVNKLKSFVLKREDNQQGEDKIDTGKDIWKSDGDGKLCGKYI